MRWAVIFALGLLCGSEASAQSLSQQIVGTWEFIVAEVKAPDGKPNRFRSARRRRAS